MVCVSSVCVVLQWLDGARLQKKCFIWVSLVVVDAAERCVVHALHSQVGARVDEVAPDGKHADGKEREEDENECTENCAATKHPVGEVGEQRGAIGVAAEVRFLDDFFQCHEKHYGAVLLGDLVAERGV